MNTIVRTTMTWTEADQMARQNPQLMPATYANLNRQGTLARMQFTSLVIATLVIVLLAILGLCNWPPIDTRIICGLMIVPVVIVFPLIIYWAYKVNQIRQNSVLLAALLQDVGKIEKKAGHEKLVSQIKGTFLQRANQ